MLRANKILPIREIRRDCKLNAIFIPRAPGVTFQVLVLVADAFLIDLEPVAIALVCLGRAGCFGHIHQRRARVLHRSTNTKLKGKLGTCLDLRRAGLASKGEGTLVAAEVRHVGGHVVAGVDPFGWVVLGSPGVGADILVRGAFLAVDDEGVEEVMSRDKRCDGRNGEKRELHFGN